MDKLFTTFMSLGHHMWPDALSDDPRFPPAAGGFPFTNEIRVTPERFREMADLLPSFGINSVLIDIGEGLRYESHPELAIEGSWSHDTLKRELRHLRKIGVEPFPKLNFSACHDTWLGEGAYSLSTPRYYALVKDLIEEVADVFDRPRLFHIGMDEEDLDTHGTGMTSYRSEDLWWQDLYYYFDVVEKAGSRPWMWSDYYWNHPQDWEKRMPKDCVQSNWFYDPLEPKDKDGRYPQVYYRTYLDLARMGYDQIPTASDWRCRQNMAQTVWLFLEEGLVNEHLLGFMIAPWYPDMELYRYSILNCWQRMRYAKDMFLEYTPERHKELCERMDVSLRISQ